MSRTFKKREGSDTPYNLAKISFSYPPHKRDKQLEKGLFVSFYPTNDLAIAVLERIPKEIRSFRAKIQMPMR